MLSLSPQFIIMNNPEKLAVVILAAGQGTRMKSKLPKVMHKVAGRPMINWLIETAQSLNPEHIIVVTAPEQDEIAKAIAPHTVVIQKEQKGTGDAVKPALEKLKGFEGKLLILLGDEPFVDGDVLEKMLACDGLSVMAVAQDFPSALGRVLTDGHGMLERVIEAKDCTEEQLAIPLRSAGNFCMPMSHAPQWFAKLGNDNAQGEYYLPDIPSIAKEDGFEAYVITCPWEGAWGINTRAELAEHEMMAQDMLVSAAMDNGVTFIDPSSVVLSWDTELGADVIVEPNIFFGQGVRVGDDVTIHAFSHIEGAEIQSGAEIGPFARIRPKSLIEEGACVGNFIEVNRSTFKKGAKSKHLSYIGDAVIGEQANIGAGSVIANYDGFFKHQSTIGERVFIGSNSTIISPVEIGDKAIIAANSTINKDVPKNAMAIARTRQENHPGWASEYRSMKRQQKEEQEDD